MKYGPNSVVAIDVTAEDIAAGRRFQAESCPIAFALCRSLCLAPGEVAVGHEAARFSRDGFPCVYLSLPDAAGDFICRFDVGVTVAPFAFEIQVPTSALEAHR